MGHSMNSLYTRRTQPYIYGDHSIFTAEVASTVNENLLMNYLIDHESDPVMMKYLLNHYLEEFKGTVFRQTMFAEFEKMTHETVAKGETLTVESLTASYADLNALYFGPEMARDEEIAMEWSRIPHFYRAFYVYKYATGFSAATALAANVLTGEREKVDAYLRFLGTGSCDYPIRLLKDAGVDMSTPEPVEKAMRLFESILDRFEKLCD
jgi:oligoendopeptidase F